MVFRAPRSASSSAPSMSILIRLGRKPCRLSSRETHWMVTEPSAEMAEPAPSPAEKRTWAVEPRTPQGTAKASVSGNSARHSTSRAKLAGSGSKAATASTRSAAPPRGQQRVAGVGAGVDQAEGRAPGREVAREVLVLEGVVVGGAGKGHLAPDPVAPEVEVDAAALLVGRTARASPGSRPGCRGRRGARQASSGFGGPERREAVVGLDGRQHLPKAGRRGAPSRWGRCPPSG